VAKIARYIKKYRDISEISRYFLNISIYRKIRYFFWRFDSIQYIDIESYRNFDISSHHYSLHLRRNTEPGCKHGNGDRTCASQEESRPLLTTALQTATFSYRATV